MRLTLILLAWFGLEYGWVEGSAGSIENIVINSLARETRDMSILRTILIGLYADSPNAVWEAVRKCSKEEYNLDETSLKYIFRHETLPPHVNVTIKINCFISCIGKKFGFFDQYGNLTYSLPPGYKDLSSILELVDDQLLLSVKNSCVSAETDICKKSDEIIRCFITTSTQLYQNNVAKKAERENDFNIILASVLNYTEELIECLREEYNISDDISNAIRNKESLSNYTKPAIKYNCLMSCVNAKIGILDDAGNARVEYILNRLNEDNLKERIIEKEGEINIKLAKKIEKEGEINIKLAKKILANCEFHEGDRCEKFSKFESCVKSQYEINYFSISSTNLEKKLNKRVDDKPFKWYDAI